MFTKLNQVLWTVSGHPPQDLAPKDAQEYSPTSGACVVKYLIILEPTSNGFSAYSPDLEGLRGGGAVIVKRQSI